MAANTQEFLRKDLRKTAGISLVLVVLLGLAFFLLK